MGVGAMPKRKSGSDVAIQFLEDKRVILTGAALMPKLQVVLTEDDVFEIEGKGKFFRLTDAAIVLEYLSCLLYTSPSPRD